MGSPQRRLLIVLGLVLLAQAGLGLWQYLGDIGAHGRFGGDFIAFWQAARHVRAGDIPAIYDPAGWRQAARAPGPHTFSWFAYPPFALFGLWPLGKLSYGAAVTWWSLAPLPFYFALLFQWAARSGVGAGSGEAPRKPWPMFGVLACLCLPFLSTNLYSGQVGAVMGALFLAAALSWDKRPWLAGVFIGLMAVKPQLGVLWPVALIAAGRWKTFASASLTVTGLAGAATLWLGPGIWRDYFDLTQVFAGLVAQPYAGFKALVLGGYVSLQAIGAPRAILVAVQAAVSFTTLAAVFTVFRKAVRSGGDPDLAFGVLAAGALLATPYVLTYDTPLLVLAITPLFRKALNDGAAPAGRWALVALCALVEMSFVQLFLIERHVPFAFMALLLTFGVLSWLALRKAAPATALDPAPRSPLRVRTA